MEMAILQPHENLQLGNLKELNADGFLKSLQRLQKVYGDIYLLNVFRRKIVIVSSEELAHYLCDEFRFENKVGQALLEI